MHKIKKSIGQNFLINKKLKNDIISYLNPSKKNTILEIGPGTGILTKNIAPLAKTLLLVELDKTLIPILKEKLKKFTNIIIYNQDILKVDIKKITNNKSVRIIGNIPYNISTEIIYKLSKYKNIIDIFLMIQKEVAERIIISHIKKNYSKFSIITNYKFKIKKLIHTIGPENFFPKPKVNSSFIKLVPKKHKYKILNYEIFKKIIYMAFNNRRKKISITLKKINMTKIIYTNQNKRAEDITINMYIMISNLYYKLNKRLDH